jgi:phosphatidylserine/phosphatidylglycerophosphate/cardiolipin synthase-like enzyme
MLPRSYARVAALALAALGCRASSTPIYNVDDVATLQPGDTPVVDLPAVPDTPAAMDAGVATMDAPEPTDTAPPTDRGRTDTGVRADVRRDAGPTCVCPTLPSTCAPVTPDTPAFSPERALLDQLLGVIACADTSLHIALYETLWDCLPNAIRARLDAAPGLTVQIVVDDVDCPAGDGGSACPIRALEGHPRVTLVPDERSALMHHKFVVADNSRVWVGSANSSQQSYCVDANDAIVVSEPAIVTAFEGEFQRMFRDRSFGPLPAMDPVRAGIYTAYFSPRSPTTTAARWFTDMIAAVTNARTSVDFIISAWTRTELSDAMLAARARGARVRGVVAPEYANDPPAVALRAAGVPVRVGDVHSKLILVDDEVVITGSANWSAAAWSNNENSLWIRDANVGSTYAAFFTRAYDAATVPLADRDR